MVSAKRVHRVAGCWRKGNGMKEREGEGRGAESFATTSAEILPSVESIMPASDSFSRFFSASTASAFRFIGLSRPLEIERRRFAAFFPFFFFLLSLGRVPGKDGERTPVELHLYVPVGGVDTGL